MADDEKLSRCKISTDTVYNTLKTHSKYAHIVRGRPTLKDVGCFRKGSVREPYERSLYERTFMSEPFIAKHALSTELSNVLREEYGRKSHRVCRPDREPSTVPVRSLKRLRNKSKKVRNLSMHVFSHVSPCHLHCTALLTFKKLLYKRTFKFNCREKIRQSIRKVKYRASRYLTLFSCNKLMCSCKNEAHVANYCNYKLSRK